MITIFGRFNDERIEKNLVAILKPFYSKCCSCDFPNMNIAFYVQQRNKIMKALHPEIKFEDYKDYVLIVATYNDNVTNEMLIEINTIENFPKTYESKAKYFIKSTSWNSGMVLTHIG